MPSSYQQPPEGASGHTLAATQRTWYRSGEHHTGAGAGTYRREGAPTNTAKPRQGTIFPLLRVLSGRTARRRRHRYRYRSGNRYPIERTRVDPGQTAKRRPVPNLCVPGPGSPSALLLWEATVARTFRLCALAFPQSRSLAAGRGTSYEFAGVLSCVEWRSQITGCPPSSSRPSAPVAWPRLPPTLRLMV